MKFVIALVADLWRLIILFLSLFKSFESPTTPIFQQN
jgi:hypothetical protein